MSSACLLSGCLGQGNIQKRTIQDLYREALHSAETRMNNLPESTTPVNHPVRSYDSRTLPPVHTPESIQAEHANAPELSYWRPGDDPQAKGAGRGPVPLQLAGAHSENQSSRKGQPKVLPASSRQPAKKSQNGNLNEIFEQTDIREAISILASTANVQVVVDDTVGGVTSATITNDTFTQALDKILMPLGLVYVYRDNKYLIAPPDPESPLYSFIAHRHLYSPLHHDAVKLSNLLPTRYKKFIQPAPERNLIMIDAPQQFGEEILQRLEELDSPVPQVELEAIVCVVSPNSGFRFGLDWGHAVTVDGTTPFKMGMTGLAFTGQGSGQGAKSAFTDFAITSAFVQLLAQEGYITIRAAPRVVAKDGEKANIAIERETFFSLQQTSANVFFQPTVQKVQAGISLEITPRVHGEMVAVNIGKAEVSEDIRTSDTRVEITSNPYPIINRRIVSTNVNVRDGQTIVIGGLVQRQTVDRVNRIPGLSRIPLAGRLFQTIEKQEQDAEVAIFICPRIVPAETCFE